MSKDNNNKWHMKFETGFGTREVWGSTREEDLEPPRAKSEDEIFKELYDILERNESLSMDDESDRLVLCQQLVQWFRSK